MAVDQIMFFALGFLIASLLALVVLPSVWKRAVRLTKKRIEAATPMTMAEFRADKDQLRAGFALTQRRLERQVEHLRGRLTEQLSELSTARSEAAVAIAERDRHAAEHAELEERHADANARVHELEREVADLAHKLRAREREIVELRKAPSPERPAVATQTGTAETGRDTETSDAVASIREALNGAEVSDTPDSIVDAYTRISSAGSHLDALLAEESRPRAETNGAHNHLADELSEEDALNELHNRILEIETVIEREWGGGDADLPDLRERLDDIASSVSRLVYTTDSAPEDVEEESLFERIRKFAGDGLDTEHLPAETASRPRERNAPGSLAERIAAFEDAHINN